MVDLAARRNLNLVQISKYVQSIEAFGLAPRSVFHVHEADYPPPTTTADTPTNTPTTPTHEQAPQERPAHRGASLEAGAQ